MANPEFLLATLEQELQVQTAMGGPAQRAIRLIDHLERYVSRFLGFARLPNMDMLVLQEGDLFAAVTLAIDALRRETLPDSAILGLDKVMLRYNELRDPCCGDPLAAAVKLHEAARELNKTARESPGS